MASGPRGPDRPAFRRAQALVCIGVIPKATVAITREVLQVKLKGQAESRDSCDLQMRARRLTGSRRPSRARPMEAKCTRPMRHRSFGNCGWTCASGSRAAAQASRGNGRWRPGRTDLWLTFGQRASLLTKSPHRATTPGNALLNYPCALLASEMNVALLAAGLDPGISMFHADFDDRSSLALDAIEAARPHVDYRLLGFLEASTFTNRDFIELSDGEIRLTHPLNAHLAYTTALWRKACQPIAGWLAQSFFRAAGLGAVMGEDGRIHAPHRIPPKPFEQERRLDPPTGPLRVFMPRAAAIGRCGRRADLGTIRSP
jgi:CRISPR associated protein Cas1